MNHNNPANPANPAVTQGHDPEGVLPGRPPSATQPSSSSSFSSSRSADQHMPFPSHSDVAPPNVAPQVPPIQEDYTWPPAPRWR